MAKSAQNTQAMPFDTTQATATVSNTTSSKQALQPRASTIRSARSPASQAQCTQVTPTFASTRYPIPWSIQRRASIRTGGGSTRRSCESPSSTVVGVGAPGRRRSCSTCLSAGGGAPETTAIVTLVTAGADACVVIVDELILKLWHTKRQRYR